MSADTLTYTDADAYSDSWQPESDAISSARKRAAELGADTPSPTAAATLAVLAAAVSAKTVVEVGTGVGITGLRLIEGLVEGGVLTSIDADASAQAAAKDTFKDAGIDSGRARLITGQPAEVLPRLADGAYDVVAINTPGPDAITFLEQSIRLLRNGGIVVFGSVLGENASVTDATNRDESTKSLRDLAQSVKDNDALTSVLLPVGDGLLAAVKRG